MYLSKIGVGIGLPFGSLKSNLGGGEIRTRMFYQRGTSKYLHIEVQDLSIIFVITLPFLFAENQILQNQDQNPILK